MKIKIPGPALFFIGLLVLYTVVTHARGIPPRPVSAVELPAGATPVDQKTVQKFLQLTVRYSRYTAPWFTKPKVYVVPKEWFIDRCGGVECGIMGTTRMEGEPLVFLRAGMEQEQFEEFLVHELVHWLQSNAGWLAYDCKNYTAQEIEAYAVQNTFRTVYQKRWAKFWTPEYFCIPTITRGAH